MFGVSGFGHADINQYLQSSWNPAQDLYLICKISQGDLANDRNLLFRSRETCKARYKFILNKEPYLWILLTQTGWTLSQDLSLKSLVLQHSKNWQAIASVLPRTANECEERWCFLLTLEENKHDLAAILNGGNQEAVVCGYDDLAKKSSNITFVVNQLSQQNLPPPPDKSHLNKVYQTKISLEDELFSDPPELDQPFDFELNEHPLNQAGRLMTFEQTFDFHSHLMPLDYMENEFPFNQAGYQISFEQLLNLNNEQPEVVNSKPEVNEDFDLNSYSELSSSEDQQDNSPPSLLDETDINNYPDFILKILNSKQKRETNNSTWEQEEELALIRIVKEQKRERIGWKQVAVSLFKTIGEKGTLRSARSCSCKYTSLRASKKHQELFKPEPADLLKWSGEEESALKSLVEECRDKPIDWKRIAISLFQKRGCQGTLRTSRSCASKYAVLKSTNVSNEWQRNEDEALLGILEQNVKNPKYESWREIGDTLHQALLTRSLSACQNRFKLLRNSNQHGGLWTKFPTLKKSDTPFKPAPTTPTVKAPNWQSDEDEALVKLAHENLDQSNRETWKRIADKLRKTIKIKGIVRSQNACKTRYWTIMHSSKRKKR